MLPFLKNVLRSEYTKERIDLDNFNLAKVFEANNLNHFELELEDACYNVKKIPISDSDFNLFVERFKVISFRITSYDIEKRFENEFQTPKSNYKLHTKNIWNPFFEDVGKRIRINPEIKIHFRKKSAELRQYLINNDFDLDKIKHRNLEDKFTLTTSFSLNAGRKYPELAFARTEELLEKISEFNDNFNERRWDNFYKYGIDRGDVELATLCIAKFDKSETYRVNDRTLVKPKFPNGEKDIKCYELREKFYDKFEEPSSEMINFPDIRKKRVIANLSYFIDRINDKEWFKEKTCTCIDLTTAKGD